MLKLRKLNAELTVLNTEARKLEKTITENLRELVGGGNER